MRPGLVAEAVVHVILQEPTRAKSSHFTQRFENVLDPVFRDVLGKGMTLTSQERSRHGFAQLRGESPSPAPNCCQCCEEEASCSTFNDSKPRGCFKRTVNTDKASLEVTG